MEKQATFSEMKNGTAEDYAIIGEHGSKFASELPNRILAHLDLLKGDTGGFAVDRFTHSIQTATRAHRDGKDEEYVVCALLPVSYTHLRAHETDSYLVCRLLLEKKKPPPAL